MSDLQRKLYLAGPDVFHAEAIEIGDRKKALCLEYGFEGLFPLDNEIGEATDVPPAEIAGRIYDANIAMLDQADAVLANVTPYQGAGADDGTAFEIGYAVARGLPIALYDNGAGDTLAKGDAYREAAGDLADSDMTSEDFGLPVNLMLAIPALRRAPIATGDAALPLNDLSRFEQALSAMRELFGMQPLRAAKDGAGA